MKIKQQTLIIYKNKQKNTYIADRTNGVKAKITNSKQRLDVLIIYKVFSGAKSPQKINTHLREITTLNVSDYIVIVRGKTRYLNRPHGMRIHLPGSRKARKTVSKTHKTQNFKFMKSGHR